MVRNKSATTTVAKEAKKTKQAQKANKKALKQNGSSDEVPIDVLVAQLDLRGRPGAEVDVAAREAPSARASFSFFSLKGSSFIFFGGEYFDAKSCLVYNDTLKWNPGKDDEWKGSTCAPIPKPRVGHAAALIDDEMYIFGGEYATVSQFHHFRDMWKLDTRSLRWQEIAANGTSPSARSGHRMVVCRNVIVLFGGFHESSRETRYHNDLFMFSPGQDLWRKFTFPKGTHMPSPRSGVIMSATNDGIFLYGGYAKLKDTEKGLQGKTLNDGWWIDMRPVLADTKTGMPVWEKLPKRAQAPTRNGCAVATHKNNVYVFGGVMDEDEGGLTMKTSIFYNDITVFDLSTRKWTRIGTKKDGGGIIKNPDEQIGYEERLGRLMKKVVITKKSESKFELAEIVREEEVCLNLDPKLLTEPLPRLNASMTIKDNCLYVMGGSLELGIKTIVFDDCWKFGIKTGRWENVLSGAYWTTLVNLNPHSSSDSEDESEDNQPASNDSDAEEDGSENNDESSEEDTTLSGSEMD